MFKGEELDQCGKSVADFLSWPTFEEVLGDKDEREFNEDGKKGRSKTNYPIAEWDTLRWRVKSLGEYTAVPVGAVYYDTANGEHKIVHLFVLPPQHQDKNVYSLHCQIPSEDVAANLVGVQLVKTLLDYNWVTGFGNGVSGIKLGDDDICHRLHKNAPELLNTLKSVL